MELHKKYAKKGVAVIAVSLDRASSREVAAWAKDKGAVFPVLHDQDGRQIGRAYDIQFFPTHLLLDRSGKIVDRSTEEHFLRLEQIEKALPALLAKR